MGDEVPGKLHFGRVASDLFSRGSIYRAQYDCFKQQWIEEETRPPSLVTRERALWTVSSRGAYFLHLIRYVKGTFQRSPM